MVVVVVCSVRQINYISSFHCTSLQGNPDLRAALVGYIEAELAEGVSHELTEALQTFMLRV